jgi:hypothetical protein
VVCTCRPLHDTHPSIVSPGHQPNKTPLGYLCPNSKPMVYAINIYSSNSPVAQNKYTTGPHSTYKKYAAPPNPAITSLDHQSVLRSMRWRSGLSKFLLICVASLLSSPTISTGIALFALEAFPIAFAVGFIVVVGSIWGGLKVRNMGFIGEPSNL